MGAGGNFPRGPVVGTPHSDAGHVGSIPRQGAIIPHAAEKLSPCDVITEPETPAPCKERSHMLQGRSRVPQLRPHTAREMFEVK